MIYYTQFKTRLWEIILVGNELGLSNLHMVTEAGKRNFEISDKWQRNDSFFETIKEQILEYFAGQRKQFDITLNPQGTDFQKRVWEQLYAIPFGEIRTYKDIAIAIGNKKACRAVGMANSKNPLPLIVPCHRVIGSNGKLTGFAHGLKAKEQLLKLENYPE
ncbi:methylated-DNA-[protein]-cysteine S-methyltransferase [Maridesulfovibrio ferrireducens]|uniref:Methylated-DNA--protein-cysteine methyltransferase n=1 Tax=Maridesulfovibrio ferrireducens TaxID=246191 RepID=A0A1G9FK56_9BACT|nr:methylated-DNA--[protein]-cysteine S-methyltransferase [Maridesulfovibrio ferrireducens]SDK88760.1 methylated-DNA-[protein]-cysteine S-methyltransferase [Maridesulfovibrio ferrireducens]